MDSGRKRRAVRRHRSLVITGDIRLPPEILPWELDLLVPALAAVGGIGDDRIASGDPRESCHAQG
jgi:hypothetical protein